MQRINRVLRSVNVSRTLQSPQRAFGAAAHGHGHAPPGPYDVPHVTKNREEAFIFGDPATKKVEGWETITYLTFAAVAGLMIFGWSYKGASPNKDWAMREAIAREAIVAAGGEIEYGRYYHEEKRTKQNIYIKGGVGELSTLAEEEEE